MPSRKGGFGPGKKRTLQKRKTSTSGSVTSRFTTCSSQNSNGYVVTLAMQRMNGAIISPYRQHVVAICSSIRTTKPTGKKPELPDFPFRQLDPERSELR